MDPDQRIKMLIARLDTGIAPIYIVNKGTTTTTRLALVLDRLKQQCPNTAGSKST